MPLVDTIVSAVTVYPDRARVTRKGSADLENGTQVLEIENLPVNLVADSVRASARGSVQARLFGVQMKRSFFAETPAANIRELEEAVEAAQDELSQLEARQELLKKQAVHLDTVAAQSATYATAIAAGEMKLEDHLALLDGLRSRAELLAGEQAAQAVEKRRVERSLQKLKNDLNQQRSSRPRQRYTALVEVELQEAGKLDIELAYVVHGAQWQPLYDLRLVENGAHPELELNYLAQVTQASGESWEDVDMSLSTARPALSGWLPELDPWYIAPVEPVVPLPMQAASLQMAKASRSRGIQEVDAMAEEVAYDAVPATSQVEEAGAAVTYRVGGRVSIPSDGAPHKTTVARFSLPARLDYVTAPRLVEAVYRRARMVNDSPYLLLPGQQNLFAGDEFLGTARLELTPPQGEVELYLGNDDRIKVKRELKRREVDKSLVGGRRRLHYSYEISLENLLSQPALVTLHDQIPVGRHEDIKVRLDSADPKPSEQSGLNLLRWEFSLAPAEKRVVRYQFSVEHPQTMEITGLP